MQAKVWEAGTDEPSDWQLTHDAPSGLESEFTVASGGQSTDRTIWLDRVDAGANAISGQVVDQNGDPVENATVESVAVDYDALNDTADDLDAEADRLLDEAEQPFPDEWDDDLELIDDENYFDLGADNFGSAMEDLDGELPSHFEDLETEYATVHTRDEWELNGRAVPGTAKELNVDPDLENPNVIVPSDEPLVVSVRDPTETGGLIRGQDSVDEDLPGATTSGSVVVEQYSPSGEIIDESTYETQDYAEINSVSAITGKTHEVAEIYVQEGHFYRIYPEGSEESAYFIVAGNPGDIATTIVHDLETKAGEFTNRSQQIQDRIDGGVFARTTTTTNETGHYELRVPTGVERSAVQAYKADGQLLQDITGPSISDLRDAHDRGYNGSVAITPIPQRTDVPAQDVTIETVRSDSPPFQDLGDLTELQDWFQEQVLSQNVSDLEGFDQLVEEWDNQSVEDLHDELTRLAEENENLRERVETELGREIGDGTGREDLEEDIKTLEKTLRELEGSIDAGDGEIGVGGDEIIATFPFGTSFDTDAVTVLKHTSTGDEPEVVDEQYWRVQSSSLLGGDEVVIEYPTNESDAAIQQFEVKLATEDGIGRDRQGVTNPAFSGDIPEINAVDFSTLAPGSSERVHVDLLAESDSGYGEITDVQAYNADGDQVNASVDTDRDRASFKTDGEGVHTVRITYENAGDDLFVVTERVRAVDDPRNDPATVRASESASTGVHAVTGEQLEGARLDTTRGTLTIDAIAEDNDGPGELHIMPQAALTGGEHSIDIAVLHGSNEERVGTHVPVQVHFEGLEDNTLFWRGDSGWTGAPITWGGDTRYGDVQTRNDGEKQILRTFTTEDGTVDITMIEQPGIDNRAVHRIARSIGAIPVPSIPLSAAVAPGGIAGLGFVAYRRRRAGR